MNVTELYQQVLGRAPDHEGLVNWTAAYGAEVDAAELANFQQAAGAEIAALTVTDLYARILGRAPDQSGLDFWSATFGNSIDIAEIATFRGAAQAELDARSMAAVWEPPKKSATAYEVERTAQNYHAAVAVDNAAAGTLTTRTAIYNAGREFLAAVAANGGGYAGVEVSVQAGGFNFGVALPAKFRPLSNLFNDQPCIQDNNAQLIQPGGIHVSTTGIITIYKDMAANGFTNGASCGLAYASSVSWIV